MEFCQGVRFFLGKDLPRKDNFIPVADLIDAVELAVARFVRALSDFRWRHVSEKHGGIERLQGEGGRAFGSPFCFYFDLVKQGMHFDRSTLRGAPFCFILILILQVFFRIMFDLYPPDFG